MPGSKGFAPSPREFDGAGNFTLPLDTDEETRDESKKRVAEGVKKFRFFILRSCLPRRRINKKPGKDM